MDRTSENAQVLLFWGFVARKWWAINVACRWVPNWLMPVKGILSSSVKVVVQFGQSVWPWTQRCKYIGVSWRELITALLSVNVWTRAASARSHGCLIVYLGRGDMWMTRLSHCLRTKTAGKPCIFGQTVDTAGLLERYLWVVAGAEHPIQWFQLIACCVKHAQFAGPIVNRSQQSTFATQMWSLRNVVTSLTVSGYTKRTCSTVISAFSHCRIRKREAVITCMLHW